MALGAIAAVTFTVPALEPVEAAYTRYLQMRVLRRDVVDGADALAWGAPAAAGCRMLELVPEVGEATRLRFVEDLGAGICAAFRTYGWNACELTVRDTDALAFALSVEGSPFRVIGGPAALKGFEWIRAMQVLGPAGECLYLTDVGSDPSLAAAESAVGQVFIVVAGGPDLPAMAAFYAERFGVPVSAPVAVPIGVINRANGLDADTRHGLALVTLPGGTRVELDQYPPGVTGPRAVVPGHLPPGMSFVSFQAADETAVGCVLGAAGELIEVLGG
jgi:hypothetical protein